MDIKQGPSERSETIYLPGVPLERRLTPLLARIAAYMAYQVTAGVRVWSWDEHGYALYDGSHQKLWRPFLWDFETPYEEREYED